MAVVPNNRPVMAPSLTPLIQQAVTSIRCARMESPAAVRIINTSDPPNITPMPFFASGSLGLTLVYSIHFFANKTLEYHKAPSTQYAIPPTSTASQLMSFKKSVFMLEGLG